MAVRFARITDTRPQPFAASWPELVAQLEHHAERADKRRGPLWSPVTYHPGAGRGLAGVDRVWCFVADLDGEPFAPIRARIGDLAWIAYTTHSHRPGAERWHLVMPLATEVPADSWRTVWASLHARFGIVGDPSTSDPSRAWYLPQHAPGHSFTTITNAGELVRPDLAQLAPASRTRTTRARRHRATRYAHPALDPAWWREPVDLSPYEGLSKAEKLVVMRRRWEELKARNGWVLGDLS
jgi:hypothetical protein